MIAIYHFNGYHHNKTAQMIVIPVKDDTIDSVNHAIISANKPWPTSEVVLIEHDTEVRRLLDWLK